MLDVRGNPGGYFPAAVDVARAFLPRGATITTVDGRGGSGGSGAAAAGRATVYTADGVGADTATPLFVLADARTASAAEVLAGALQENGRASAQRRRPKVNRKLRARLQKNPSA